ncbi:hypothetical protein K438DRAFT_1679281 [Mycena galopus ATCC 62051]|nr:hypothetical protein K438DRAFT_1679281 [Mycena galopus ATCC 62051]
MFDVGGQRFESRKWTYRLKASYLSSSSHHVERVHWEQKMVSCSRSLPPIHLLGEEPSGGLVGFVASGRAMAERSTLAPPVVCWGMWVRSVGCARRLLSVAYMSHRRARTCPGDFV